MTLHITDPVLDALAEQTQRILNAPSKEDAVRQALVRVVGEVHQRTEPVSDNTTRSERLQALRDRLERLRQDFNMPPNESLPPFDEKAYLDEMWGENDVHR
ncbi:type II toxin-antitoxin system VapB family antitoxin [Neorhizobium sp. AL 9.2.2]|uniref:type II toxin-antitoxin system VapB family antitoxin n=1 Tax=unclassified Neorhizobium TaxID=2629175 RepID=UPI00157297C0|nr:type II toxin-antitoxin system VapB family antitoxin [Neorhizobium sp. AL 9.2.2]NSY16807.1 type II toxin-antitoxin system VapB family antitoxin [Neorhizobium sp. AL 9.2.2]